MATSARVTFELFDVTAKADSSFLSVDKEAFVDFDDIKLQEAPVLQRYATCEVDQFLLDGSLGHFPEEPQGKFWGYWSQSISGVDGAFQTPPMLEISFTEKHSSMGLTLGFHHELEEWPTEIEVRWLSDTRALLYVGAYSPNSSALYIHQKVEDYKYIRIIFTKTNKPFRRMKLSSIDFGLKLQFSGEDVVKAKCFSEIDLLSSELAIGTLDLTLFSQDSYFAILNPAGAFSVLQSKQRFIVDELVDGTVVPVGVYYLSEWSNSSSTLADFKAVDKTGILDGVSHAGGIYDTTAGALVADILSGYKFNLEETLASKPIKGYLAAGTKRTALQQFAFAVGAVVDCSGEDILIFPPPQRPSSIIGANRKFLGSKVSLNPLVTGVVITTHSYAEGNAKQELLKDVLPAGNHRLTFNSPYHTYECTGARLLEVTSNYVVITTIGGEVLLTAYPYIETKLTVRGQAKNVPANAEENLLEVEGATLVSPALGIELAERILSHYENRYVQTFSMRVNKENLADYLIVETFGGEKMKGSVVKMDIDLAGGFLGSIEILGKRIDTAWKYYAGEMFAGEKGGVL